MLKHAIVTGEFEPGQPLTEVALAEWSGVSRTPVREALLRLEQDGLVARTEHGLEVRERSPEEILDIYSTRMVLEAAAAKFAAERRTEHDVRQLMWSLEAGAAVAAGDSPRMVEANQQFHDLVWGASHNESLVDVLERLSLHVARYPGTTLSSPGRWDQARREHAELVNAIRLRDEDGAHEIAMRHFLEARDIRLRLFAAEAHQGPSR